MTDPDYFSTRWARGQKELPAFGVQRDFAVYAHCEVPAGDGGLSLGQALVAGHLITGTKT